MKHLGLGLGSCWIHRAKEVFEGEEGRELLKEWGIEEDYRYRKCYYKFADGKAPKHHLHVLINRVITIE